MIIWFKYCVDVENCESFSDNDEFEFKLDLLER